MKRANLLLLLAVLFMALHWVHVSADPTPQLGMHVRDGSGDLYTDEGWDSSGAIDRARFGHWYQPGDFNLAVDAPVWSAILAVPFQILGVSAAYARALEVGFFAGAVVLFYFLLKSFQPQNEEVLAWAVLILATNYLAFNFSRLSILESVWTFFMVASLLVLTKASRAKNVLLKLLAGILLGLAVTTKATAVFALLPAAVIILLVGEGAFLPALGSFAAYGAGLVLTFGAYVLMFRNHYRADHEYYGQVNMAARVVHSLGGWAHSTAAVIAGVRYFGLPTAVAFLAAVGFFLTIHGRRALVFRQNALLWVLGAWIVGDVIVSSAISYHPARYLLNPLFPVAGLIALSLVAAARHSRATRVAAFGILILITAAGAIREVRALLHPRYTLDSVAQWMASNASQPVPVVMGDCANTLALQASIRPMDDLLGVAPRSERIRRHNPEFFVSLGPALAERTQDFAAAGRSIRLVRTEDVLDNYVQGKKLYIYRVDQASNN